MPRDPTAEEFEQLQYLFALIVVTQQGIRQRAEGGKQHSVGGAKRQDHVGIPCQGSQTGAEAKN